MGLTERHWFEDEEPELTEQQLEDIIYENKKAYDSGKEYSQIVRCKNCKNQHDPIHCQMYSNGMETPDDWFCADGERR